MGNDLKRETPPQCGMNSMIMDCDSLEGSRGLMCVSLSNLMSTCPFYCLWTLVYIIHNFMYYDCIYQLEFWRFCFALYRVPMLLISSSNISSLSEFQVLQQFNAATYIISDRLTVFPSQSDM